LADADRHSKPISTPFCVRAHRREKGIQRSWLIGEDDSSLQAKQGWKHSLDLAACCVQRPKGTGMFCWSTFVAKQDNCHL